MVCRRSTRFPRVRTEKALHKQAGFSKSKAGRIAYVLRHSDVDLDSISAVTSLLRTKAKLSEEQALVAATCVWSEVLLSDCSPGNPGRDREMTGTGKLSHEVTLHVERKSCSQFS